MRRRLLSLSLLFGLAGCGGDPSAEVSGERPFDFPTGEFALTTLSVDDRCLDGALHALFMPEGAGTPWAWERPVTLHPPEDLPKTADLVLRAPFGAVSVTYSAVDMRRARARGAQNRGVPLDEERFGACVADLDADVDVQIVSTDLVSCEGVLTMSDPRGDPRCPVLATPCEVALVFKGERL